MAICWTVSGISISFVTGSPGLDKILHVCTSSCVVSPVLNRGEESFPPTCWQHLNLLIQFRITIAFYAARAHWQLMFNLLSFKTPRPSSAKLLSSWVAHSIYCCLWLFLLRCRTFQFPLLNFMRFLSASSLAWQSPFGQQCDPLEYQPLLPNPWCT